MKRALCLLALLLFGASSAGAALRDLVRDLQQSRFELLGTTQLTHGRDAEVVGLRGVCPSPENRPLRAVLLKARDGAAYVDRVGFRYAGGHTEYVSVNLELGPGQASQPIDLAGDARCVSEIFVVGHTLERGRPTLIDFSGLRALPPASTPVQPHAIVVASTPLAYRDDTDVLRLPPCGSPANPPLRAVQLRVLGSPAEIDYLTVEFQNGERRRLDVGNYFDANSASRVIDLVGEARCLQSVQVAGQSVRRDGPQAVVELLGYADPRNRRPPDREEYGGGRGRDGRDGPDYGPGGREAVVLGATELGRREDADVVGFPRVCGVGAVQVQVEGGPAEIESLALTFANRQVQELRFRTRFEAGTASRPIDLEGDARCVDGFQVVGRSRDRHRRAVVRVVAFRTAQPQPLQPKVLGSTRISSRKDVDFVRFPEACGVRAVQLVVKDARVKVDRVEVLFANGQAQELPIHKRFRGASPVIDLVGRARCLVGFRIAGKAEAGFGGLLPQDARVQLIGYGE